MSERPDFDALRAKRNEAVAEMVKAVCDEHGWDASECHTTFDPNACYCACGDGGPCEHQFEGWRDIEDDEGNVCGGETVCSRCGMGAMSHSMRIGM